MPNSTIIYRVLCVELLQYVLAAMLCFHLAVIIAKCDRRLYKKLKIHSKLRSLENDMHK